MAQQPDSTDKRGAQDEVPAAGATLAGRDLRKDPPDPLDVQFAAIAERIRKAVPGEVIPMRGTDLGIVFDPARPRVTLETVLWTLEDQEVVERHPNGNLIKMADGFGTHSSIEEIIGLYADVGPR